jgi:hypothetical protein
MYKGPAFNSQYHKNKKKIWKNHGKINQKQGQMINMEKMAKIYDKKINITNM